MMYEWSSQQKNLILITGHTHQPVFESLTHFERLQWKHTRALYKHNPQWAQALEDEMLLRNIDDDHVSEGYLNMKNTYFNTGCCCYSDGDITGIEIADGYIRLIKWEMQDHESIRSVLEEKKMETIIHELYKSTSKDFKNV
jgi:hypothetical protein